MTAATSPEYEPCINCGQPTPTGPECPTCAAVNPAKAEIAAYTIGSQHAESGAVWDTASAESTELMEAFGEYGPTTEENADYRGRICDAYNAGIASIIDRGPVEEGTWR